MCNVITILFNASVYVKVFNDVIMTVAMTMVTIKIVFTHNNLLCYISAVLSDYIDIIACFMFKMYVRFPLSNVYKFMLRLDASCNKLVTAFINSDLKWQSRIR